MIEIRHRLTQICRATMPTTPLLKAEVADFARVLYESQIGQTIFWERVALLRKKKSLHLVQSEDGTWNPQYRAFTDRMWMDDWMHCFNNKFNHNS